MIAMMVLVVALTDEFDRLEGQVLSRAAASSHASSHESLTFNELGTLPTSLRDSRKAVLIIKTDEGNLARLIVTPGFRRPSKGAGEPFPVLSIERLDTMEAGSLTKRIARARDMVVFDGFLVDLDSGQVVPEGQGGDLRFVAEGPGGAQLQAIAPLKIMTFKTPPVPEGAAAGQPSLGRTVTPTDFDGRYLIYANGQTSGILELKSDEDGGVAGRMSSDQTGSSYKIQGKVGERAANRIAFSVELPRTRQDFEGYLFSEGKSVITGSYTILDRSFGFMAIRDGTSLAVDGGALATLSAGDDRPGKLTVELGRDGLSIGGKATDEKSLVEIIRRSAEQDPSTWILLKVGEDDPVSKVVGLIELLRSAGADRVRLSLPPG